MMTNETAMQPAIADLFQRIIHLSDGTTGQNRLVYTPRWVAAQKALIAFAVAQDLSVSVDDYGTVYMDLPGRATAPAIATGSHMDTVVHGGQFDGLYGVLGGLQALLTLRDRHGQPHQTLRAISFSEEEGSRFPTTFSGSKHYARLADITGLTDDSGASFDTARITAVTQLQQLPGVTRQLPALPKSFTELHIEQGPRLITTGRTIGLVSAIVGQRRFTITVTGTANHAGTTPMNQRHDALQAAITLMSQLRVTAATAESQLTFTVGQLTVSPNTSNVIPGKVVFTVDCRHADDTVLGAFETAMRHLVNQTSAPGITASIIRWVHDKPAPLAAPLLAANRMLATQLGFDPVVMDSGAGHDSEIMSRVTPTTMIFVPSVNGISHAPNEYTAPEDLAAGIKLLTASLFQQAY
ncbi:M20 family metallo-hydrolase [Secundilactobacillus paracollinoides]|uniref:M20 family metallo-hydrolase n=1 Tax=Secundilactobacillus paracollinoides TaxID=240427 RepID=UPI0006F1B1C6|nr:M20 family metallo-hydrolase [Secundilactobacillus paracollinoides]KRL75062.1 N-carbamoyl-L-amino-acid hydrolase [Secundilactobacillus paracollinoides DSM 15502 = JCM 11969]